MLNRVQFTGRFLRRPLRVGAIAPSSDRLADVITSWGDLHEADVVVEYGPGTGAFTSRILARLKPGATFIAIELDRVLCQSLRRRFPEAAIYRDSAVNVMTWLRRHGLSGADCIVSGLPWAAFGSEQQRALMDSTLEALTPGGRFVTFAYLQGLLLPSGRAFRRLLLERFPVVRTSPVVWRNLPPAFVYQCTR
jgi:phospholipid N-methyltransferase